MEKIIIIGCPGAGKSTLSLALGQKLHLPVVHLDKLFWRPGWVHVEPADFDKLLELELRKDRWIIDGNYSRTLPQRLDACDTVIYLDFPAPACLWGVIKRVITTHGITRPDMGENCPERFDAEFMGYVAQFNRKNRKKLYRALTGHPDKNIVILNNRRQVQKFLDAI